MTVPEAIAILTAEKEKIKDSETELQTAYYAAIQGLHIFELMLNGIRDELYAVLDDGRKFLIREIKKENQDGERMILKKRTPEERKAYIEGYNACNKQFRKYLKKEKTVEDAIKTMDALVFALNGVIDREVSE